jgi:hypothetical protein
LLAESRYVRACRARLRRAPSLSQVEMGMEFLNWLRSPHSWQTPSLVGPFGLSMIQW